MTRSLVIVFSGLLAAPVYADSKTYQVTGPVVDVRNDTIVVEKGKERWEIARDPKTKIQGQIKRGARVTVEYRMMATTVDVKPGRKTGRPSSDARGKFAATTDDILPLR